MSSRPALRPPLAAVKDRSHSFSSCLSFVDWSDVVNFEGLSEIDILRYEERLLIVGPVLCRVAC